MYMQEPETADTAMEIERAPVARLAVVVPALLTLALGVFPSLLFGALESASVIRF